MGRLGSKRAKAVARHLQQDPVTERPQLRHIGGGGSRPRQDANQIVLRSKAAVTRL